MAPIESKRSRVLVGFVVVLIAASCAEQSSPTRPRAPAEAIPGSTLVPAGELTEGTFVGKRRQTRAVDAFRIATRPVTVGQYTSCVAARVCAPPELDSGFCSPTLRLVPQLDGPTYELGEPELPVTCTSFAQARRFCAWVGGRLPTSTEWQLAARGSTVRRFAWGDTGPTCAEHWRTVFAGDLGGCCGETCADLRVARVALHAAGASPHGIEDVLTSRSELVGGDDQALWPSCRDRDAGCVVTGSAPGAIDALLPASTASDAAPAPTFRCAWEEV